MRMTRVARDRASRTNWGRLISSDPGSSSPFERAFKAFGGTPGKAPSRTSCTTVLFSFGSMVLNWLTVRKPEWSLSAWRNSRSAA